MCQGTGRKSTTDNMLPEEENPTRYCDRSSVKESESSGEGARAFGFNEGEV